MIKRFYQIVMIICLCFSFSYGQGEEIDLKEKLVTIKMEKQHLAYVLRHLMVHYDIAIGFEQSTLDADHGDYDFETNSPTFGSERIESVDGRVKIEMEAEVVFKAKQHWITINIENKSLEMVLDIIVKQMQNYKWEINDSVVNIFPIQGRDARFEKLLGTDIYNFTFVKGKAIREITSSLMALPELKSFLIENKLNFTGIRSGVDIILDAQYGRKLNINMNFSYLTFRELLNNITKIKRGGWILKKKRMLKTVKIEHIDIDI